MSLTQTRKYMLQFYYYYQQHIFFHYCCYYYRALKNGNNDHTTKMKRIKRSCYGCWCLLDEASKLHHLKELQYIHKHIQQVHSYGCTVCCWLLLCDLIQKTSSHSSSFNFYWNLNLILLKTTDLSTHTQTHTQRSHTNIYSEEALLYSRNGFFFYFFYSVSPAIDVDARCAVVASWRASVVAKSHTHLWWQYIYIYTKFEQIKYMNMNMIHVERHDILKRNIKNKTLLCSRRLNVQFKFKFSRV